MKTIRIAYENMWSVHEGFPAGYILDCFPCLRGRYRFELSHVPQLVFYSVYEKHHVRPVNDAIPVIISWEAWDAFAIGARVDAKLKPGAHRYTFSDFEYAFDPEFFDFGITSVLTKRPNNHYYWPGGFLHLNLYHQGLNVLTGIRPPNIQEFFCNFIQANPCSYRVEFLGKLMEYRRVECCGPVGYNNDSLDGFGHGTLRSYQAKQRFQNRCKFTIAFENCHVPGYNSEKITDAFVAGSVPIYSGDPHIEEVFNPKAIINVDRFESWDAAIDHIKEVDQNPDLYQSYLNESPFTGNRIPSRFSDYAMRAFWDNIFERID